MGRSASAPVRRASGKRSVAGRETSAAGAEHDVRDLSLAAAGRAKIVWSAEAMPVLLAIRKRFERKRPLAGVRVACCLHVTSETANLMITLKAGGAQIALCASNPLSTQDDVAASLVKDFGIPVFAVRGETRERYYRHLTTVLARQPQLTMDDGADLISMIHQQPQTYGR